MVKIYWKTTEEVEEEKDKKKEILNYLHKKEKAEILLMDRIAEDYILSKNLGEKEKDIYINLFDRYEIGKEYIKGSKISYQDNVYEVVQKHTSQKDWKPNLELALYKLFYQSSTSDGTDVIPEWKQSVGDIGMYQTGDLVSYIEKIWECIVDDNVWKPGEYGWVEYL